MNQYPFEATVYIGRFQPIHRAHLATIYASMQVSKKVIIAIGSSKRAAHIKNPWTSHEREKMILDAIKEYCERMKPFVHGVKSNHYVEDKIKFIHIRDYKYNNVHWAQEVYSRALGAGATSDEKTRITGCYKDDTSFYLKMFPQWTKDLVKEEAGLNATDIREELLQNQKLGGNAQTRIMKCTHDFLRSWIHSDKGRLLVEEYNCIKDYHKEWESAPYKPVFVTVDAVVVKSGHILLIRRGRTPGLGLLALPGGFLNQDESLEDAMVRELKEETKIKFEKTEAVAPIIRRSIKMSQVFDHPKRSERGRTVTHAFLVDLGEGPLPTVKGADDAAHAFWLPIADLGQFEDQFYEDHIDIITSLTRRL